MTKESNKMTTDSQRDQATLDELRVKVAELAMRVRKLEDASHPGFVCERCRQQRPPDWFIYEETENSTGRRMRPICGECAQRGTPGWRFHGPFPASAAGGPENGQSG